MTTCSCGIILRNGEEKCQRCRRIQMFVNGFPAHLIPAGLPGVIVRNLEKRRKVTLPEPFDRGFFLYGPAGHGKSHQAAALLLNLLENGTVRGISYKWVNVPEMLFTLRSSYQSNQSNFERDLIESCAGVDWLCLDDLGAEKTTDWTMSTLYLIINKRYESGKITVVTSNLSFEELEERFGDDRLVSRIQGMCEPYLINSKVGDRRIPNNG